MQDTGRSFTLVLSAIVVVLALLRPAYAQLPIGPGSGLVSVTAATPGDFFYLMMESQTVPEVSQNYTPITDYLTGLNNTLADNLSPGDIEGWTPLSDTSTEDAVGITEDTMGTYTTALGTAQSVLASSSNDVFTPIEASSQGNPYMLSVMQAQVDALIALGQQMQYANQLLGQLVAVESIHHMWELDAIARAQASNAVYPINIDAISEDTEAAPAQAPGLTLHSLLNAGRGKR